MKNRNRIAFCLAGALLLGGCALTETDSLMGQEKTDSTMREEGIGDTEVQAYRQLILELQQQWNTSLAEWQSQAEAYEAQIRELEERLEAVEGGSAESPDNGHGSGDRTDNVGKGDMETLYTYVISGNGVIITAYLGNDSLAEVPAALGGLLVKGIGEGAFRNSSVEQVILPEGMETIGWFAFQGSYRLRSVILPASVKGIGYGAFENCSSALKFTCLEGSYAAAYAVSYGIPVIAKGSS